MSFSLWHAKRLCGRRGACAHTLPENQFQLCLSLCLFAEMLQQATFQRLRLCKPLRNRRRHRGAPAAHATVAGRAAAAAHISGPVLAGTQHEMHHDVVVIVLVTVRRRRQGGAPVASVPGAGRAAAARALAHSLCGPARAARARRPLGAVRLPKFGRLRPARLQLQQRAGWAVRT